MKIQYRKFCWLNNDLFCGGELGYVKLNAIFKYKFNEFSFSNLEIENTLG